MLLAGLREGVRTTAGLGRLLGKLCQVAWDTVRQLMAEATAEEDGFRTGMVAVVQSAGDLLELNPHVHAIVPRGGWDAGGSWVPVPYVDCRAAELLFRHGVIAMLRDEGLLGQERIDLLMSWRSNTGFSVHNSVTVEPEDPAAVERLGRYLLRPPLSDERLTFDDQGAEMRYRRKRPSPLGKLTETLDPLKLLARVLVHVAEPRLHGARYYGHYSCVARGRRSRADQERQGQGQTAGDGVASEEDADASSAERRRLRRQWAQMLRRIFEVDPLTCTNCGGQMKVITFITDPPVVRKILSHLGSRTGSAAGRGPPDAAEAAAGQRIA